MKFVSWPMKSAILPAFLALSLLLVGYVSAEEKKSKEETLLAISANIKELKSLCDQITTMSENLTVLIGRERLGTWAKADPETVSHDTRRIVIEIDNQIELLEKSRGISDSIVQLAEDHLNAEPDPGFEKNIREIDKEISDLITVLRFETISMIQIQAMNTVESPKSMFESRRLLSDALELADLQYALSSAPGCYMTDFLKTMKLLQLYCTANIHQINLLKGIVISYSRAMYANAKTTAFFNIFSRSVTSARTGEMMALAAQAGEQIKKIREAKLENWKGLEPERATIELSEFHREIDDAITSLNRLRMAIKSLGANIDAAIWYVFSTGSTENSSWEEAETASIGADPLEQSLAHAAKLQGDKQRTQGTIGNQITGMTLSQLQLNVADLGRIHAENALFIKYRDGITLELNRPKGSCFLEKLSPFPDLVLNWLSYVNFQESQLYLIKAMSSAYIYRIVNNESGPGPSQEGASKQEIQWENIFGPPDAYDRAATIALKSSWDLTDQIEQLCGILASFDANEPKYNTAEIGAANE
jgi:hypothetical protein